MTVPAVNYPRATSNLEGFRSELLVTTADEWASPKHSGALTESLTLICDAIAHQVYSTLTGKETDDPADELTVSMMVYDPTRYDDKRNRRWPALVIVGHNRVNLDLLQFTIPVGSGIAGLAYKIDQSIFYSRWETTDMPKPYFAIEGKPEHDVLYCIPLHHPTISELRMGIVINVGSYKSGSCLLPPHSKNWSDHNKKIAGCVQSYAGQRLVPLAKELFGREL